MKKKKTKLKKNKLMKRTKIMILIVIMLVIGFVGLRINKNDRYMNNVKGAKCYPGWYCDFFQGLVGDCCKPCGKGTYCSDGNRAVACPNGRTTRGEGKTSESDCELCKDSKKWFNGSSCVSCEAPYYCEGGERKKCALGKTIKKNGSISANDCVDVVCKKSEFINDNDQCETCPKNHYCDGKIKTACDRDRITNGTGKTSSSACICPPGTYDKGYCIICPVGSYCNNGKQEKCPTDYTSVQGKSAKTDCYRNVAAGKSIISNKLYVCAKGAYSEARVVYYGTDSRCTKCPKGTYQDKTGQSKCKTCPQEYTSSTGAKAKTSCYRAIAGGKSIINGKIYRCSKGSYSTERKVNYGSDSRCTACKAGTYQNLDGQKSCKKCSSGYSSKQGASYCTRSSCPAGSYLDSSYSTGCRPCPSGKYCSGGTALPKTCNSGQKVNSNKTGCVNCSGISNCARYGSNGISCWCTSCNSGYTLSSSTKCTKVTKPCGSRGSVGECTADNKCKWDYSYGCRNK